MSIQIKLKNSVVQDSTPSTSDLPEVGELAVNANINSIGGFMRASNNTIVKIFGPGSLSTPTATTTVSGISELATNSETTTGTATNRVVTPAGLNAVTVAERTTSNNNYVAKAGSTLTGVLTMPNGSNSAPAINFGDSDSGIFGGTNTVSLSAGGTTRLTADTGVSVVGTLAVTGSITATSNLTIGDKIIHAGDTNTAVRFPAADTVSVETGGSEAFRVDSSGRLLVGTSTARSPGTIGAFFQIEGTTVNTSSVSATRNSADNAGANFVFNKTRGTSIGSDVVVNSGDQLGIIRFCGNDGTDSNNTAVSVSAFVDGTPGSNDMPGRLVFSTTADGASTPTDRLTIDSAGLLKIPDNGKFVAGTGGDLQIYHDGSNSYVQDIGEGKLILATNGTSINLFDSANSNTLSKFTTGGSVELYHNGNKKLETTSSGVSVTGAITGTGNLTIDTNTFHVDTTNNRVGIGTASPAVKLHISGTSGLYTRFQNTSAGNNVNFGQSAGDGVIDVGGSFALRILTNGSDRVKVDSSGRLLLGTTTEGHAAADELTISNTASGADMGITLRSATDGQGAIYFSDGTSGDAEYRGIINYNHSSDFFSFFTAASEGMRINSSGDVLFYGTIRNDNVTSALNISGGNGADSSANIVLNGSGGSPANVTQFRTGSTERMRIASDGKIGINEVNPVEMLHIKAEDNTDSFGGLIIKANNNSVHMKYGWRGLDANSGGDIRFAVGGTEMMRVLSSGKVGLGRTSADEMLHIKADDNSDGFGGLKIDSNNGSINCKYGWLGASGSNSFRIAVAGTERMRVASDGKVGIGTTSPSSSLDVNGDITISSSHPRIFLTDSSDNPDYLIDVNGGHFLIHDVTNAADRLKINSSGNVGIGISSPSDKLHVRGASAAFTAFILDNATNSSSPYKITFGDQGQVNHLTVANREMTFGTNNTERMRIHQSGAVSINTTTSYGRLHVKDNSFNPNTSTWLTNASYVASNSFGGGYCLLDGSKGYSMYCHGSGANFSIQHHTSTTATASGGVQLTNGATSWTGMSDERDKENLVTISDAITKIKTLRTVIGNYIWQPDVKHAFLIAQDVQAVLPEAVDIMNTYEETEKQRLGLRYTEVIPLLTAALQEAIAKIEILETKVAALEAA